MTRLRCRFLHRAGHYYYWEVIGAGKYGYVTSVPVDAFWRAS